MNNLVDQLAKIDQDTAKKMGMIEGNNTKLTVRTSVWLHMVLNVSILCKQF